MSERSVIVAQSSLGELYALLAEVGRAARRGREVRSWRTTDRDNSLEAEPRPAEESDAQEHATGGRIPWTG